MKRHSYILATAGHVDHGKSSLVRALTGTDPDRLPEEKARGMTIDLGFAHFTLPAPAEVIPPAEYEIGVVDVPGHEDFVRNMVAGVGSVDVALLVVAADDGWMPQTEEHLQILTYLGVCRGLVALTKADLPCDIGALRQQIGQRLQGTALQAAPIVATSTHGGQGMEEFKATLACLLSTTPPREDMGLPRLPVDRVFTLRGVGTVATGTLAGGTLNRGQAILVQSQELLLPARIRALQTHHREVVQALPGSRIAMNLPDLHPAAACQDPHRTIRRGDVITEAGVGRPSTTLDVQIWRLDRHTDTAALPNLLQVQVHLGSACIPGRVILLQTDQLQPGEQALAHLRLEHPVLSLAGDRVVLRDAAGRRTLAGATVLDAVATQRRIRHPARLERLATRAAHPDDAQAWLAADLRARGLLPREHPLEQTQFAQPVLAAAADGLVRDGQALTAGQHLITRSSWDPLIQQAAHTVDDWHRNHPEQSGISISDLRSSLGKAVPADLAQAVIDALCAKGFIQHNALLRRSTHRPTLPPRLQAAGDRLRTRLADAGLDVPSSKQLAPDPLSQQALRFLVINGEAVEIGPDTVISAQALARARCAVQDYIRQHGPATVAQLKTALGSSRRIMVPLLERLDRDGLTIRRGDLRILH